VRSLRTHLAGYAKGDKDIFGKVEGRIEAAIANGVKLTNYNAGNGSNNPSTDVHILADFLKKLKPG